ncbi:MAG: ATP-dependent DNA helicase RecQ [Polyangiales bacterium]
MIDIDSALRDQFGLDAFHPWQREAIGELLEGRRKVVVIAPTGGGKSLCYQLPASVLEGTSVVVSPLIALMEDQVRALTQRGIAATYLASTLGIDERRERERAIARGEYRLVYVAPERLGSGPLVDMLARLQPPLVAIDEAHCISQWGHDFRPSYLRLGEVIQRLRPARVLACTATATPLVRAEIQQRLGLDQDTAVILRGFSRPNLHLEVFETDSAPHRRKLMLRALSSALGDPGDPRGAAIVYAATRRNTEKLADAIAAVGWRTRAYHAGLPAPVREDVNARFANRDLDVVVATNAFGMGIDRADIRAVVHVQAPGSVEAYYQEVGRAGRDGQPAHGLLLTSSGDFGLRRRLLGYGGAPGLEPVSDSAHVQQQWRLFLDLMRYVEAGSCRHDFILRYFGDEQETLGGCGHCDVCERFEHNDEGEQASSVSEDDALVVRKALSGIARNQRRAGLTAVADMLHGTDNERIRRLGLADLSTHGLLAVRSKAWILVLLRRLMTAGLVDLTATEFPVPFLTERGVATMKGDEPVRVLLPRSDAGRPPSVGKPHPRDSLRPIPEGVDSALFERLREARLDLAKTKGVPAYMICQDRTLLEIASVRPATAGALADIYGMGPARIESFGQRLLETVRGAP